MAEFSYFDQFKDYEVDLNKYLTNLSPTYYFSNTQPVVTTISNLFDMYEILNEYKQNINVVFNYEIPENLGVEMISFDVYENHEFWWLIFVFNNIKNPFYEWPLTQEQLISLADNMYAKEGKYSRSVYYDYLFEQNELKRYIKLPEKSVLPDIIWKYRNAVNING